MSSFDHHRKHPVIPATVVGEEGSAKRNIIRKGGYVEDDRKERAPGRGIDDGSTYTSDPIAAGQHDPNYDSEEETGFEVIPKCDDHMTLVAYKKRAECIISDFFLNGDMNEAAVSIQEIGAPQYTYEFVKRVISMSMDRTDRDREAVSQLLSALWPNVFSSNTIGKGFERLFEITEEIEKDVPAAKTLLSTFLARAVIDEVLPPSFLSDAVVCTIGGEVVEHAKMLLSRDHAGAKLERIWGPGDGRPVEDMKVAVDQAFQEYLLSGDTEEAVRCLAELNAALFFHEVVKRGIINSLDGSTEKQESMSALFAQLFQRELLSSLQAQKGFDRVQGNISDLLLDSPNAKQTILAFIDRAKKDGILPSAYVAACA